MKHDSVRLVIHLLFHETIQSRSLQVIPDNMRLVLRLDAKIQVLSNVDVFLNYLWLVVLVCRDLNLKCTQNFAQGAWIIVEERLAQVVKILRSEL